MTSNYVVSLGDVKAQLGIRDTRSDVELSLYVLSASQVVEYFKGPCAVTTFTETVTPCPPDAMGRQGFVVSNAPLVSVTSITPQYPNQPALDLNGLQLDPEAGIAWLFAGWTPWACTVVYGAGTDSSALPESWQLAARIIVQHLWQTKRGGAVAVPGSDGGDDTSMVPGFAFAVPNRALALLNMSPGFASAGFA